MKLSGPDNSRETGMDHIIRGGRPNVILYFKHHEIATPMVEVYAPGKPARDNYEGLQAHFDECLAALRDSRETAVTVIGLGVPDDVQRDDPRLARITEELDRLRGSRSYVDPVRNTAWEKLGFTRAADTLARYVVEKRADA